MDKISQSIFGQMVYCKSKKIFHLEFGNIILHLSYTQVCNIYNYILGINEDYYLELNKHSFNKRKILLEIGSNSHHHFCVNKKEFVDLKNLLCSTLSSVSQTKKPEFNQIQLN